MIEVSDNIHLKAIKIEDQPKLLKLVKQIYPPAYEHLWVNKNCSFYFTKFYSLEHLKLELSDQNAAYYFVIYKSVTVGIFRLVYNTQFKDFPSVKSVYVNRIYLSTDAQGKGIAKTLFNWMYKKAAEKNCEIIWLKAMDSQMQALRFYEKQNFRNSKPTQLNFELMHPHPRGMYVMYKRLSVI